MTTNGTPRRAWPSPSSSAYAKRGTVAHCAPLHKPRHVGGHSPSASGGRLSRRANGLDGGDGRDDTGEIVADAAVVQPDVLAPRQRGDVLGELVLLRHRGVADQ